MAQIKTPEQILTSLLGPRVIVDGVEVLGPNEGKLLDALRERAASGLSDFQIRWSWRARRMPREVLAGAAFAALVNGRRAVVAPDERPGFAAGL